jgi:acyl-CoA reductase-like NAD-dependent aldehyde dehydrogenase
MSTDRLIVDESVADAFVGKLAQRTAGLPSSDPRGHVVLGSLVNLAAAERMDELIDDAKAKGAVVAAGGNRNGTIVDATIVDRVTRDAHLQGGILRAGEGGRPRQGRRRRDPHRHDREYRLSAAVFSRDVQRALRVGKRIESGI